MSASIEQELRERMGLSHNKRAPAPVPSAPIKKEIVVDVDAEVRKYPSLGWYVQQDRRNGFSERTIANMLPTYMKTLGIEELEHRIAREMGVPKPKDPAEPSQLEKRVRKESGLL
jgi:hypothetical protein